MGKEVQGPLPVYSSTLLLEMCMVCVRLQVFSVNSKKINNLADLVGIVDACKTEYLK